MVDLLISNGYVIATSFAVSNTFPLGRASFTNKPPPPGETFCGALMVGYQSSRDMINVYATYASKQADSGRTSSVYDSVTQNNRITIPARKPSPLEKAAQEWSSKENGGQELEVSATKSSVKQLEGSTRTESAELDRLSSAYDRPIVAWSTRKQIYSGTLIQSSLGKALQHLALYAQASWRTNSGVVCVRPLQFWSAQVFAPPIKPLLELEKVKSPKLEDYLRFFESASVDQIDALSTSRWATSLNFERFKSTPIGWKFLSMFSEKQRQRLLAGEFLDYSSLSTQLRMACDQLYAGAHKYGAEYEPSTLGALEGGLLAINPVRLGVELTPYAVVRGDILGRAENVAGRYLKVGCRQKGGVQIPLNYPFSG